MTGKGLKGTFWEDGYVLGHNEGMIPGLHRYNHWSKPYNRICACQTIMMMSSIVTLEMEGSQVEVSMLQERQNVGNKLGEGYRGFMILLFPFSWKHSITKCWKTDNLPHLSKNWWNPFPSFFLTTGQAELNCDLSQWCAKAMGCGGAFSSNTPSYTSLTPVNHAHRCICGCFRCAVLFLKTEMHTQVRVCCHLPPQRFLDRRKPSDYRTTFTYISELCLQGHPEQCVWKHAELHVTEVVLWFTLTWMPGVCWESWGRTWACCLSLPCKHEAFIWFKNIQQSFWETEKYKREFNQLAQSHHTLVTSVFLKIFINHFLQIRILLQ